MAYATIVERQLKDLHEQVLNLTHQYHAGLVLLHEFFAEIEKLSAKMPSKAKYSLLLDPATGLRYPKD